MWIGLIFVTGIVIIASWGSYYSRLLAKIWGERHDAVTPAVSINDGRDYVPTPTPVVFAHHFASIAGAGPILGPVIALCYGWLPAVLWVVLGGLLIGAVHDYLATHITLREGGESVAVVARRVLGKGAFAAFAIFLVVSLALVCATFLNLSARARESAIPLGSLGAKTLPSFIQIQNGQAMIGGIASTSVIIITIFSPLVGWLYLKKQVAVWKCSILAIIICAISTIIGIYRPVQLHPETWKIALSIYVFFAAGLPVWLFLQSRDFINVHMLYAGMVVLGITVLTATFAGTAQGASASIPATDFVTGQKALGLFWPFFFITIACGAVSGFHSLCAGGTTCKQLKSEPAARHVGYWAMLLETTLSLMVITVMVMGLVRNDYLVLTHPQSVSVSGKSNPILAFAMALGNTIKGTFGFSPIAGAIAAMLLLEGFLVTTLDTAVRLMRYLLQEVWKTIFNIDSEDEFNIAVQKRPVIRFFTHHYFNSAMAVALMLFFSYSAGILALWGLFATANQLLAGFVLGLGSIWLIQKKRKVVYTVLPAIFMLITTGASLWLHLCKFRPGTANANPTLFTASIALVVLTLYLIYKGLSVIIRTRARSNQG